MRHILIACFLLLSACGVAPAPTATPQPSPTTAPTATPATVSFSKLSLDSVLIQSGDLPAGVSGEQIRSVAPPAFKSVPLAEYTIDQRFQKNGQVSGGVTVFVYKTVDEAEAAYAEILKGMDSGRGSDPTFGSVAVSADSYLANTAFSSALFVRCSTTVHIQMSGVAEKSAASYAQRLDKRLQSLVCQPGEIASNATPRPTATPLPTATPKPKETPIVINGKGDDIVNVNKWTGFAAMRITATGARNFTIWNYDKDGKKKDLLVNTIGDYAGIVLLDVYDREKTTRLEVTSSGTWKFEILPIPDLVAINRIAVCPDCNVGYTGKGDDVVYVLVKDGYTPDLMKIEAPNATRNFIVQSVSASDGLSLLVNKIGPYSGTTILPKDTFFFSVRATGPWKATITGKPK